MLYWPGLVFLGLAAGILSGLIGIGGGIIIVPVLVLWFGMSQQLAQEPPWPCSFLLSAYWP